MENIWPKSKRSLPILYERLEIWRLYASLAIMFHRRMELYINAGLVSSSPRRNTNGIK
ncbi:MAG TPA: hypothetical protein VLA74_10910 [Nitrososphaeraceae archaeon]|nr:hypothetical protein [Nitrososphaeraceae archaeon]